MNDTIYVMNDMREWQIIKGSLPRSARVEAVLKDKTALSSA
jgi:hypothetical protein